MDALKLIWIVASLRPLSVYNHQSAWDKWNATSMCVVSHAYFLNKLSIKF